MLQVHDSGMGKAILWKKRFSFGETRCTGLCTGDDGPDLPLETLAGASRFLLDCERKLSTLPVQVR